MPRKIREDITLEGDPETVDTTELSRVGEDVGLPPVPQAAAVPEPTPAPPAPAPPPLPAGFDMAAFAAMLAGAIQQGTAGAIESSKPTRSSRDDWEYEHKSAFNREGDLHHPRPGLVCETFFGVLREGDDIGKPPIKLYPIDAEQLKRDEQEALNAVTDGRGQLDLNDGTRVPFEVYIQRDRLTQAPQWKVLALPKDVYGKDKRNQLPRLAILARLMAEGAMVSA